MTRKQLVSGAAALGDHFAFIGRAVWIAETTKAFLDAPMPEKK